MEMNRGFIMTERDGMYALVGRPKPSTSTHTTNCIKEMKYAILITDGKLKILICSSTQASTELVNEVIQLANGKILKTPEAFELAYPKRTNIENSFLSLDVSVVYNNQLINSDITSRKLKTSELWNSSQDFIEIELPTSTLNECVKQNFNTSFCLNVCMQQENNLVFSYSNTNINGVECDASNSDQEFYSSVSVNPVFIPLK